MHSGENAAQQHYLAMAQQQAASNHPTPSARPGVFDVVLTNHATTLSELRRANMRLGEIADRIFGSVPSPPGQSAGNAAIPAGKIVELSGLHDQVLGEFSRLFDTIDRLEGL